MGLLDRLLGNRPQPPQAPQQRQEPEREGESWYVPNDRDASRFTSVGGPPPLHLIEYRDSGGEKVLRLCEDSTGLLVGPSDNRLPKVGIYVSQLRGEAYHEAACRAGDFTPGAPVTLKREPDNPHDKNAVAVFDATGRHMAAYVNKQQAARLSKLLDAGKPVEAVSLRGTKGGSACSQVAILAAEPTVLQHLLSPRPSHLPTPAHLR